MANLPEWRAKLQPASYNGIRFHVEVNTKASGRRIVPHEFPKRDTPWSEDMGRRIRRFVVQAYIIYSPADEPDYEQTRDDLIEQFETEGPGLLVLPTGLHVMADGSSGMVVIDSYSVTERREKGGFCEFEIAFLEAGQAVQTTPEDDTQSQVNGASQQSIQQFINSDDISQLTNPNA